MKLFDIPKTKLICSASETFGGKRKNLAIELLIFLAVAGISMIPQTLFSFFYTLFALLRDPEFIKTALSDNVPEEALNSYAAELTSKLSPLFYIILLAFSGFMILAAILFCKLFEKRGPATIGFVKKDYIKEYALGALIGLVMISLPVLFCVAVGNVKLSFSNTSDFFTIVFFFFAFMLQGMGEEALFRGYLMTSLSRRGNIWLAIILNSLIFSLFHIANSSFNIIAFINIMLFGIFASVFMLKRGSIWAVGAIHSVWNFAQGNIFGFNVSGNPKFAAVFNAEIFGSGLVHGGSFGPEGGLAVTILLLLAVLASLMMPIKKGEEV